MALRVHRNLASFKTFQLLLSPFEPCNLFSNKSQLAYIHTPDPYLSPKFCSYCYLCLKWALPIAPYSSLTYRLLASLKTQLRWHLYREIFLEPSSLLWWLPVIILSYYFLPCAETISSHACASTELRVICRQGQCLFVCFLTFSYLSLNSQHLLYPCTRVVLLNS